MTVCDIVVAYLRERGYDGLANINDSCGCGVDDLAPCGDLNPDCVAAHLVVATDEHITDGCDHKIGERIYWGSE